MLRGIVSLSMRSNSPNTSTTCTACRVPLAAHPARERPHLANQSSTAQRAHLQGAQQTQRARVLHLFFQD